MNNPVEQKKLSRKEAMYWWISLRQTKKVTLTKLYYSGRNYFMLTGREIEHMWLGEEDKAA